MGCVNLILYDEEFARRQQLADIMDRLRSVWDEFIAFVDSVWQAVKEIVHTAVSFICTVFEKSVLALCRGVCYTCLVTVRRTGFARIAESVSKKLWRRLLS